MTDPDEYLRRMRAEFRADQRRENLQFLGPIMAFGFGLIGVLVLCAVLMAVAFGVLS